MLLQILKIHCQVQSQTCFHSMWDMILKDSTYEGYWLLTKNVSKIFLTLSTFQLKNFLWHTLRKKIRRNTFILTFLSKRWKEKNPQDYRQDYSLIHWKQAKYTKPIRLKLAKVCFYWYIYIIFIARI